MMMTSTRSTAFFALAVMASLATLAHADENTVVTASGSSSSTGPTHLMDAEERPVHQRNLLSTPCRRRRSAAWLAPLASQPLEKRLVRHLRLGGGDGRRTPLFEPNPPRLHHSLMCC